MIFDSHTHLNAEQFNDDIPETIDTSCSVDIPPNITATFIFLPPY